MIANTQTVPASAPQRPLSRALTCDLLKPLPIETLSRHYWTFLSASVFFDLGFGLCFFLFNLYLNALHFNERSIGMVTSAFTIGALLGTYPAGLLARRLGLRPLLTICMLAAPVAACARLFVLAPSMMMITSFFFGLCMCGWAVCTPTALARLTTEANRSIGFSLNFAVGIGAGVLAGFIGGRLPSIFVARFSLPSAAEGIRWTLFFAAMLVCLGALPLLRKDFLRTSIELATTHPPRTAMHRAFLIRFLIAFAIWSSVAGALAPFTSLYLLRQVGLPLHRVGTIFALSQLFQVAAILSVPVVFRRLRSLRTIVTTQLLTAGALLLLARLHSPTLAAPFLIALNAVLYMAGPTIYGLLMTHTDDSRRSMASAAQSFTSSLVAAGAAWIAGALITRHGYPFLFMATAGTAVLAAIAFLMLVQIEKAPPPEMASAGHA